jgi:hypothetical protein
MSFSIGFAQMSAKNRREIRKFTKMIKPDIFCNRSMITTNLIF